ncbi:MAG: type II toxin-antitoxin system RelE/ParE family toxin [Chloroflexi bacterium]|nr:type II toxin-antitoxin system RelE/ParE family toxin [Chloroflexota bacterium]
MALFRLEQDPRPPSIRALTTNVYRLRVGRYRVIYEVDDEAQEVLVGRIERRQERTYRDWQELF